jgi:hypothetical protein
MANRAETLAQNSTKTNQKARGRARSLVNGRVENEIPIEGGLARYATKNPLQVHR